MRIRSGYKQIELRRELRSNQTPSERTLWKYLKNRQVLGVRFLRQYSVGPYVLDFFSPSLGLCIEMDGEMHFSPEGYEHDLQRDAFLKSNGIDVLRIENEMIWKQPEEVITAIESRILELNK